MARALPVMLLLGLLLVAVPAEAAKTQVFSKVYVVSGSLNVTDPFFMPDPGGPTPVACYYRTVHGFPTGAMVIRVVDHRGNHVFVDEVVGTPFFGAGIPLGLLGVIPGTWTVRVTAVGTYTGVNVTLAVATHPSLC
jgi:hypothetical protein